MAWIPAPGSGSSTLLRTFNKKNTVSTQQDISYLEKQVLIDLLKYIAIQNYIPNSYGTALVLNKILKVKSSHTHYTPTNF